MLLSFYGKTRRNAAINLYNQAVRQARRPLFYAELGAPDTIDGRFDLIALHVFLILRRLRGECSGRATAQALFDHMFVDMDKSLREQGVGDLSVPRHVRRMMNAFHGRCLAYNEGLDSHDPGKLVAAIERNIYAGSVPENAGVVLAGYIRHCDSIISQQPLNALNDGRVEFIKELKHDESDTALYDAHPGMVA